MPVLTLQDLLEAGTHFGHQTKRWNPKMKRFILCPRNGIYIIDLNKTVENLEKFLSKVREHAGKGGKVLFVGTKKQIKDCVREEAERCGMPYVTERWLGGMLTNFQTIKQSIAKLEKIEKMETDGTFEALTKKERQMLLKRKEKLLAVLSGVRGMKRLPALLFMVDTIKEHIGIAEARRLKIPIGAIVDTNCNPDEIDFPIPGNDDAIKSVQLITKTVADTILACAATIEADDMKGSGGASNTHAEALAAKMGVDDETFVEELAIDPALGVVAPADTAAALAAKKHRVVRRKITKTDSDD